MSNLQLNTRQQNRYGTSYEVTFPDYPTFVQTPQWIRITQKQKAHDVVHMAFATFDKHFHKALKTGVLCKITWRTEHAKGEWYGHVYSGEELTQATLKRNTIVRGIGSSFPLKKGGNKIWKNKTAPEVVQDICKEHGIKAVVDDSKVRFGMQSLVGLTQWEKIQELADRIGFHARMEGATLYFQRIDSLIDQFSSIIPIFSYSDGTVDAGAVFHAQTLDRFKAKVGDLHESSSNIKNVKLVHSINPITGESNTASSSPNSVGANLRANTSEALFSEVKVGVVAETRGIGQELAKGFAQLSRFSIHGEADGQGDPRISPYKTVEITGTGETTDGFWVVKTAEHFMTYDGKYTLSFTCMSDGTGKNKSGVFRTTSAGTVPTRNVALEIATEGKKSPATPKIDSRIPLVTQTQGGYATRQRKWVKS